MESNREKIRKFARDILLGAAELVFSAALIALSMGVVWLFPNHPATTEGWVLTGIYFLVIVLSGGWLFRAKELECSSRTVKRLPFHYTVNVHRVVFPPLCAECGDTIKGSAEFVKAAGSYHLPTEYGEKRAGRTFELNVSICLQCYYNLAEKISQRRKILWFLIPLFFLLALLPWVLKLIIGWGVGLVGFIMVIVLNVVMYFTGDRLKAPVSSFAVDTNNAQPCWPPGAGVFVSGHSRNHLEGVCEIGFINGDYSHQFEQANKSRIGVFGCRIYEMGD